jgi:hypothetical protein
MKIGIITVYNSNPMHARLRKIIEILETKYSTTVINKSTDQANWQRKVNGLSLWYFDFVAIIRLIRHLRKFDIIYLQDSKLLPLAIPVKLLGIQLVFEVLDNNPHFHASHLANKWKLKILEVPLRLLFIFIEKLICSVFIA